MKLNMGIAALVMGLSVFISRLMGLIRDKVISWEYGIGGDADIYFAAFVIPDFINYLLAGGYVSITLIPLLTKKFENNTEDAWKFFGTVFSWAAVLIIVATCFAFYFAHSLVPFIAPGFDAEQQIRLVYFLRIILPAQVFFLLGACLSALLYLRREFTVPALMPLIYNGFILLCGMAFPYFGFSQGMEGFCWGVLIGAFFGAFALPYFAARKGGLKWNLGFKHKDLKKFLILALPLMFGQSVVVLDEQFVRIFGSMAGDGAISLLNYARRIMLVPVGVVAQAAALASFPFLASLAVQEKYKEFDEVVNKALTSSLIFIIPITAFMILTSELILGLIFEGGSFSSTHTAAAKPLLQIMLISVPFWAIQQIIGRAFYAKEDTITPAIIGTLATFGVIPLYFFFVPRYGAVAVATITTTSLLLYTAFLVIVWIKKFNRDILQNLLKNVLRSILLVLPSLFFAWYALVKIKNYLPPSADSSLSEQILLLCVSGSVFSLCWLFLAWNLARNQVDILLSPFKRKLKKIVKK